MNRRIAQILTGLVAVVAVLFFTAFAAPPITIVATTTDQDFLNNVVGKESGKTTFSLAIVVSGKGNYYKYKIGPAATTIPSQAAGYSAQIKETVPLAVNIASVPDGPINLCLQGLEVDSRGKIKTSQPLSQATVYTWVKDTMAPGAPASFEAVDGEGQVPLIWLSTDADATGYLVVRRAGAAVEWVPTAGGIYSPGDLPDGTHRVVYVGGSTHATDLLVVPSTTYHYAAFAFDAPHNYSVPVMDSATPTEPSGGGGNYYWHPQQLVGLEVVSNLKVDDYGDALANHSGGTYCCFLGATSTWTAAQPVPDTGLPSVGLTRLDGDRTGHYIWGGYCRDGDRTISVKLYSVIDGWGPATDVDGDYTPALESTYGPTYGVALCANGTAMTAWPYSSLETSWRRVTCARRFDGNNWGLTTIVGEGTDPVIAADDAGNFMVIFEARDTEPGVLYFAYYSVDTGWRPAMRLTVHNDYVCPTGSNYEKNRAYEVASTGVGRFVALYRSNSAAYELGRYDELHARAFDDESGWGLEQNLDRSGDNISAAHLAGSDDGTAIAVWEQSGVAWASHFDTVTWATVPTRLSFAADGYYGPVLAGGGGRRGHGRTRQRDCCVRSIH